MERVDAWVQMFREMSKEEQLEGLRRLSVRTPEHPSLESRLRARFEASGLLENRSSAAGGSTDGGCAASFERGRADASSAGMSDSWAPTPWED